MKNKLFLVSILLIFLFSFSFANILLPNGEAPYGIQYDANSDYLGQHKNTVAPQNQTDIDKLSLSYNLLTVDIPAKFVWVRYTGNPVNDFNFDAYDALCAYAYSKGMYCSAQMIVDGTGYLVGDYNIMIDTNFNTTKANPQSNYPNDTPTFSKNISEISMWDTDLNKIIFYANYAMALHYANNQTMAMYIAEPNEGLSTRLAPENSVDANTAWHAYLTTKYTNIAGVNTAYGTAYGAIPDVGIPWSRTFPVTQQKDWWDLKTQTATSIYSESARALSTPNANKIVTTIKILPDYLYPEGTASIGYSRGIDLNYYISKTANYVDAVSCDIYSSQTNPKLSALTYELRLGLCKALGDSIGKPVYLAEFYNSVTAGNDSSHDANMNAQMIAQSLSYVGADINSGIRGISVFTYDAGYGDKRDIKGTANETLFSQMSSTIKQGLKNNIKTNNTQIAICDNTNINVAYNLDYWRYEPLIGFLDKYRQNDNNTIKFYLNTNCKNATEAVMYANQIAIPSNELLDLNTWVASGGTLITGYRFADSNETNRSAYGGNGTRSDLANYLSGTTAANMQNNQAFDVNVNSAETIFTNISSPTRIFSITTNVGDFEMSSTGSGAVKEAVRSSTTGPLITSRIIGLGKSIHIGFNLYESYDGTNTETSNWNTAFRDILEFGGKSLQASSYTNFYAWTNPYFSAINSFGATSGTYTLPTDSSIKTIDLNVITSTTGTSYTLGLTNGQAMTAFKSGDWYNPTTTLTRTKGTTDNTEIMTFTCLKSLLNNCYKTYYSYNGLVFYEYVTPVNLPSATYTIRYYSTDTINNTEPTKSSSFIVPTQGSSTTCSIVNLFPLLLIMLVINLIIGGVQFKKAIEEGSITPLVTYILATIIGLVIIIQILPILC